MSDSNDNTGTILGTFFKLRNKIGRGSFGDIYLAEDLRNGSSVAVKIESINAKCPQLEHEYKVYSVIKSVSFVPKVFFFGIENGYRLLVIELLDKTLEELIKARKSPFSLKTVLMLGIKMLDIIQYIHSLGIIHRDLKPDNFMIGIGRNQTQLYLIDYGLSRKILCPKTGKHIPYCEGLSLTGTARYASISSLKGCEQSRRDDLESIGYILVYLLVGKLPWMGLPAKTKEEKYERILTIKRDTSPKQICLNLPSEFLLYFEYVMNLGFEAEPDYEYLKLLFYDMLRSLHYQNDNDFDWCVQKITAYLSSADMFSNYRMGNTSMTVPPSPSDSPREEENLPLLNPGNVQVTRIKRKGKLWLGNHPSQSSLPTLLSNNDSVQHLLKKHITKSSPTKNSGFLTRSVFRPVSDSQLVTKILRK